MTFEEFYGSSYERIKKARETLEDIARRMESEGVAENDLQPVVYYCSRIKKPDSMARKLKERGFPVTLRSALTNVYDAVGIRIVCSFTGDVLNIVEKLEKDSAIEILEKKDYLSRPKPNGYRSVHLCVRLKETGVLGEIQIRTIAMDFWATLEHQLQYKKNNRSEALIRSELKRCADEIASADLSMQTIREIINEI